MRPLPAAFGPTRDSLRALACFVVSPARKALTGRIGLRSTGHGFGTPPFDDGSRIVVRGDQLVRQPTEEAVGITTLRAAAEFVGLELSPDPGVGSDLPPYRPDVDLAVDIQASLALGDWYALGQSVLDRLAAYLPTGSVSEAQLWPEHFDLAVTIDLGPAQVNVGFSPGDSFHADPYVYVGPHDLGSLSGDFWNAPFGAIVGYSQLAAAEHPDEHAVEFINQGLALLRP